MYRSGFVPALCLSASAAGLYALDKDLATTHDARLALTDAERDVRIALLPFGDFYVTPQRHICTAEGKSLDTIRRVRVPESWKTFDTARAVAYPVARPKYYFGELTAWKPDADEQKSIALLEAFVWEWELDC